MKLRGALAGALLTLGLLALGAAPASAARFNPCSGLTIVLCGHVVVPIDPSGAVKGATSLHVEKVKTSGPERGAIIALAGGPGQAATPLIGDFRLMLDPALHGRDLVVFDQRGTGFSDQLLCSGLGSHNLADEGVGACAQRLGALGPFYSTSDSVSDLDAVRRALGLDKISIFGVSYGTKVALDYATRYPQHIDHLILDSVVKPGALDPYELSSFAALPRIVNQICASDACAGISTDPNADLGALVRKLTSQSLAGEVVNGKGQRRRARLRRSGILSVLFEGDFDPTLRADFPAAIRSALSGDAAPMLRLVASVTGAETFDPSTGDSEALFAATSCEDAALPWAESAPVAQRLAQGRASFDQIPPASYAPFDPATVFKFSLAPFCATWPTAGNSPPVETAPPPAVPTMILSGDDDLRTPQEDAGRVAATLPKATLVKVPNVGHSVLGDDLSSCSTRALQHFFRGQPIGACLPHRPLVSPSPIPPRSLSQVPLPLGKHGRSGRTFGAVQDTVADVGERLIDALFNSPDGLTISPVGGLRAGYMTAGPRDVVLHGYSWVPGVTVSGKVPDHGSARLVVAGRAAARGVLVVSQRGRVRGVLGGHEVSGSFASAAAKAGTARATAARLKGQRFEPFLNTVLPTG